MPNGDGGKEEVVLQVVIVHMCIHSISLQVTGRTDGAYAIN